MLGFIHYLTYKILLAFSKLTSKPKLPYNYGRPRIMRTTKPSENISFVEFQKNILNQNRK